MTSNKKPLQIIDLQGFPYIRAPPLGLEPRILPPEADQILCETSDLRSSRPFPDLRNFSRFIASDLELNFSE